MSEYYYFFGIIGIVLTGILTILKIKNIFQVNNKSTQKSVYNQSKHEIKEDLCNDSISTVDKDKKTPIGNFNNSKKTMSLSILIIPISILIGIGILINSHIVSAKPLHLQLEVSKRAEGSPVNCITLDILGGSNDPSTKFEIYINSGSPERFPKLETPDYYAGFRFATDYAYWTVPDSRFEPNRLNTILVVQKKDDKIIGYSDLCTFKTVEKDNYEGIDGNPYKYLPKWPDSSGPIIASGPAVKEEYIPDKAYLNNWLSASPPNGAQWFNSLPTNLKEKYEDTSAPNFYERNPYYLMHIHNREKFFIIDDTRAKVLLERNPNASDYEIYDEIDGIIRTPINISDLT